MLIDLSAQAITWTNDDYMSIGPLKTNFIEILIESQIAFNEIHLKMLSA